MNGDLPYLKEFFPSKFWSLVSGIGLLGWILAVLGMIRYGFRADGTLSGNQSFIWVTVFVILYSVWIMGLKML